MAYRKDINISAIPLRTRNDEMKQTWCFLRENNHCLPHFHQCVEVLYVEEGEMSGMVSGTYLTIKAGQMIVVSGYALHSFNSPSHSLVIVAVIPMDFVPAVHSRLQDKSIPVTLIEHPDAELIQLIHLLHDHSSDSYETVQGLSQTLLSMIMDRYGIEDNNSYSDAGIMYLIIPYMQQNYKKDISLDDIAQHFNYSSSHIAHLFHNQLHTTYTDFLNGLRCRHAASMLCAKGKNNAISAIAEAVGFNSISTFYRVFKQYYGVAPYVYKKQNCSSTR